MFSPVSLTLADEISPELVLLLYEIILKPQTADELTIPRKYAVDKIFLKVSCCKVTTELPISNLFQNNSCVGVNGIFVHPGRHLGRPNKLETGKFYISLSWLKVYEKMNNVQQVLMHFIID